MQKLTLLNTFGEGGLFSWFSVNSRTFSKSEAGNTILLQVKVLNGKINGTTLAMHLIKITACSSFAPLWIIDNLLNVQIENMLPIFSSVSFSLKSPWTELSMLF